jgi:hypothetical protein
VGWTFFYMFVILKIPILAAFWLIWWAIREPATPEQDPADGDGGSRRHRHPRGRPPRPPRRGPHAAPPPAAPSRVRAAARRLDRAHRSNA